MPLDPILFLYERPSPRLVDYLANLLQATDPTDPDYSEISRWLDAARMHLTRPAPCALDSIVVSWTTISMREKRVVSGGLGEKLCLEMTRRDGGIVFVVAKQKLRKSHFGNIYQAAMAAPSEHLGVLTPIAGVPDLVIKEYNVEASQSRTSLAGQHVLESPVAEFKALQLLGSTHRNILQLYACCECAGYFYAVFPLCTMSLHTYAAVLHAQSDSRQLTNQPDPRLFAGLFLPPLRFFRRALAHASAGLAYMHARGIVHRDLTADNILVTTDASSAVIFKIIDFGLSKGLVLNDQGNDWAAVSMDVDGNNHPLGVGKAPYEAPETYRYRCTSQSVPPFTYDGPACDVWSLGICALHVASNHMPFASASWDEYRALPSKIAHVARTHLSDDAQFYELASALLTYDPARRPRAVAVGDFSFCNEDVATTAQ